MATVQVTPGQFSADPLVDHRREEEGVYDVHDWAEVHRLHERDRLSKSAIARRLGISRPTVIRLLELRDPPRYERRPAGSKLDPYKDAIAEMLDSDPEVPATVILDRLRPRGYSGGITILKDHVGSIRPAIKAARAYQRTSYPPGELVFFRSNGGPISLQD